jgi:acyl-CoA synthetase (NDP forming)
MEKLRRMFYPESVAIIGASANPEKWGFGILHCMIQGKYQGKIYPINLQQQEILGLRCYKSLADVPGKVDVVVLVVPAEILGQAVEDTIKKRPAGVIIITAGLGEVGDEGKKQEAEIAAKLKAAGIEGMGPNCQGILCSQSSFYPQYVFLFSEPGKISILTQSGNVGASTLGKGVWYGQKFSKLINYGNEAVTPAHVFLDYLTEDPDTGMIAVYVEGVKDGRAFFEALKRAALKKPVVLLKGGQTEAGSRAVSSHSGAMAGKNDLFMAACRQAGAIVTPDLDEFFYAMLTLANNPIPKSNRIGIVTWGGGWGVLATDGCAKLGLELPRLPDDVFDALNKMLAYRWSRNNPVDLATSGGNRGLIDALQIVAKSPAYDGIIHIGIGIASGAKKMVEESFWLNTPGNEKMKEIFLQGSRKADEILASKILKVSRELDKPILVASDMACVPEPDNWTWKVMATEQRIIYPTPNVVAQSMNYLVRRRQFLDRNK